MAKFKQRNLLFKDGQKIYFDTAQGKWLSFDGSETYINTTLSGVTPTADGHLTRKDYVDALVATASGTTDHSALDNLDYASAGHTGFAETSHTVVSHSDTNATGAELNELTDGSILTTNGLHYHDYTFYSSSDYIKMNATNANLVINGVSRLILYSTDAFLYVPLTLQNGTNVNEFSTDGTLTGNSDDALPTEKAVKTYVDAEITTISGGVHSELSQLDYASAAHTGFQPAGDYVTDAEMTTISGDLVSGYTAADVVLDAKIDTTSGTLQTDIDAVEILAKASGGQSLYMYDDAADIGGYEYMYFTPSSGTEDTDAVVVASADGQKYIGSYVTFSGSPGIIIIPGGKWSLDFYCKVDSASGVTTFTGKMYKRALAGAETLLFEGTSGEIDHTSVALVQMYYTAPDIPLLETDRLVVKWYVQTTSVPNRTFTYYYQGNTNASHINTPIPSFTSHTQLEDIGVNTHPQIDTHIDAANPHSGSLADLVDDTTPQLGGDLDLNEFYIELTPAPSSDHTGSGDIAPMTVGESVVFGDLLYMKSDGKLWKADADAAATMPAIAIAAATISADASGDVIMYGFVRDDTWAWTVGGEIYASTTAGGIIQTVVSGTGDCVQPLGMATHADRIWFKPVYGYVEVA